MEELLKPDTDGFFKGDVAKTVLKYLLEAPTDYSGKNMLSSRYMIGNCNPKLNKYPCTRGYYQDEKTCKWVAFDNSSNECFVEDFPTEEITLAWLRYEIDITKHYNNMETTNQMTYRLPVYWIGALFYGDYSGLTDEEEIEINEFLKTAEGHAVDIVKESKGFYHSNDAGTLPCDCYDYIFNPT